MPRIDRGSPKTLREWYRRQNVRDTDEVRLVYRPMHEADLVLSTWTPDIIATQIVDSDGKAMSWEDHVLDVTISDCNERGQVCEYGVEHVRTDGDSVRTLGSFTVKKKPSEENNVEKFDGSSTSMLTALWAQNERLMSMVVSQSAAVLVPMQRALDYAHERNRALENERAVLTDRLIAMQLDALRKEREDEVAKAESDDQFEGRLMKLAGMAKMLMSETEAKKN